MMSLNRRRFLACSAALAAAGLSPRWVWAQAEAGESDTATTGPIAPERTLRVLLAEADGSPLDRKRGATLTARDMANDTLPQRIASASGRARVELASEPIQLACRLDVPGFGEVYCWADNDGRGYSEAGEIEFVVSAARTRAGRVNQALIAAEQAGVPISDRLKRLVNDSNKPLPPGPGSSLTAAAYENLRDGLRAGEELALACARHRIAKLSAPRKDFRFGAMISPFDRLGEPFARRVSEAFSYATISWYWWQNEEPPEQRINYSRMDASLAWCKAHGLGAKGFGYVYMINGATPDWLRKWPYERMLPEYERVVRQTAERYRGQLDCMEIINEAHDKANIWKLNHEQIVEITRRACAAARAGDPGIRRQINHCSLWGEYARKANADGSRRWTPYRYLKDCIAGGVDFEVVGLQLYYPQMDLFGIERMLDRFKEFGRPIHITEIATASEDGLDPTSMRKNVAAPGWHGPWSLETQAEWLEGIYTIVYSKPEFEAIGWWDLTDQLGHFWPFGGLLDRELKPKPAYLRLKKLQKDWGVAMKGSS